MNEDIVLIPILAVTIASSLFATIWLLLNHWRSSKLARMQTDLHLKLLDKFGSSPDLLAYMNSEAGKQFLESATLEPVGTNPYGRILTSVQIGLIVSLVGVALLFLTRALPEGARELMVLGVMAVALGAGFLLSAGASYRLSKSFGLLERAFGAARRDR